MFALILDFLSALPVFSKLIAYFRGSPLKDMEKAHDAEAKVDGLSDSAVADRLRSKWER